MMFQRLAGGLVLHAVGGGLVQELAVSQGRDGLPVRDLEAAPGGESEGQGLGKRPFRAGRSIRRLEPLLQFLHQSPATLGVHSPLRQRRQPMFQRLVPSGAHQGARERPRQRPAVEQVVKVQQAAQVQRAGVPARLGPLLEQLNGLQVSGATKQARPQFDDVVQVGVAGPVGGQVAQRIAFHHVGLVRVVARKGDQRMVPVHLPGAHPHGRPEEAVTKLAARGHDVLRGLDVGAALAGTVEQHAVVLAPQLRVPRHRLVVQAQVVGLGAKEDMGDVVGTVGQDQWVLVPVNLLLPVRAPVTWRCGAKDRPGASGVRS